MISANSHCKWLMRASLGSLLLTWIATTHAQDLQPFSTDGCSAFPDGGPQQKDLWLDCCIAHDRAYWLGGTYTQREAADEHLRQCVQEVGEPAVAALMLIGVRVGGSPFWPTPYRWGYGWPYPRGYGKLAAEELAQAQKLISQNENPQSDP